ncbi:MAG: hypothetical protein JSW07_10180 [bacterium]|nr:MAG: hypothetical protein JSW07_10180 [bacterium]
MNILITWGPWDPDRWQVAKAGNAAAKDLRDRKTAHKVLRQMATELSYRYSNAKQKEIGAIFGVDYSTVSQSRTRLKAKLKSSRKLKQQIHRIRDHIMKMSNSKIPFFFHCHRVYVPCVSL